MCESVVYKCFVATDQGRREYMEDFVCVNRQPSINKTEPNGERCRANNQLEYFAVFDGHGGCDAATFAQRHLLDEIKKQRGFWSQDTRSVSRAIVDGFISTNKAMRNVFGECLITDDYYEVLLLHSEQTDRLNKQTDTVKI